MFSERIIDDVEQKKERTAKSFFLYPARKKKDGSEASFEEKWKRGAPKNRKWCNHQYVRQMRADFAQIQNEVLAQNGFSIRVDHRSLEAQKEEAKQNGDTFLARLFSRVPEKYIVIIGNKEDDEPRLERLKEFRSLRKQHFDLVMKLDATTKESDELEIKDAVKLASSHAKELMDSNEYARQKFVSPHLSALNQKMLTALADVNKWKRIIISQHDAQEQAKLEYMSKAERELWQRYFETFAQKKHWENFLKTLRKPDEKFKNELKAYEDVVSGVKAKIFTLFFDSLKMKKSVEEIQHRLASPEFKNNIALVTHQILQANVQVRKMLSRASAELDKAVVYNLRGDGKGYYATRYPNGGGLSTYYPLVLATQRDNISSYGKLGDLAPESIKRLYDEMQKYAPTTEPKKPSGETKPPGDKTDMADSSKANRDRYDLSDFSEIKPEVDYVAKTASIQLDKTQLERISGVRCQVVWFRYYEDENLTENIEAIFLGGDTGIRENWKTGKFESTFSGKWLKINGQPVFVQVVTDTTKKDKRGNMTGYEIYAVPIILNDRPCTLNISCEYPTETYRILSAQPDSDSDIPVDEIYGLNKGDVVRPVYLHIKVSEEDDLPDPENATQSEVADSLKDKISWVAGNPFTIGDSVKVEKNALPNGKYAYIFELVNPVGGANGLTEPVVFFVKNGKISSAENTEDIEPEPLED